MHAAGRQDQAGRGVLEEMATTSRGTAATLGDIQAQDQAEPRPWRTVAERLFAEGFAFDFFQAVRLLEKLAPERRAVGHDATPRIEAARFRAHLSVSFPASAIHQIEPPTATVPAPAATVAFMGLIGPSGVLPRLDDLVLLYYAGLLAHRPRCALSLERLLEDYFSLPVRVLQFQGEWLRLDPESQSRFSALGGNTELGLNVIAGERVWNVRS